MRTVRQLLEGKKAGVITIDAAEPVRAAIQLMADHFIGALPVLEAGRLAGIISERDVIYCLRDHGSDVLGWPISRVMTAPAITVDPSTPVLSALAMISQRRIRHLPVVADGRLVGIVSIGDLVKHRIERIESEAAAMREYIQSA